jgi:hypothetical protein
MGIEWVAWVVWVAVGAVLAAVALFGCFSFGVVVGYTLRDRLSRRRRCRVEQEQRFAEAVAANSRTFAKAIGVSDKTVPKARSAAGKHTGSHGKALKKIKLTVVTGGVPEPGPHRTSTEQQR